MQWFEQHIQGALINATRHQKLKLDRAARRTLFLDKMKLDKMVDMILKRGTFDIVDLETRFVQRAM